MDKQPITIIVYPEVHYYPMQEAFWSELFPFVHKLLQVLQHLERSEHQMTIQLALSSSYYRIFANPEFQKEMDTYLNTFPEVHSYWDDRNQDINQMIAKLLQKKCLKVLATSTGILPYATTSVGTELQLQESITCLQRHLQEKPTGFWFPYGMYAPGLDLSLQEQGFSYTFVSSETVQFADPSPANGGLSTVNTPHGLTVYPLHVNLSEQFRSQEVSIQEWVNQSSLFTEVLFIYSDLNTLLARLDELEHYDLRLRGSDIRNKPQTGKIETVHLCQSFLPNMDPQSFYSKDLVHLWDTVYKMEQEIEKNRADLTQDTGMNCFINEWLDLAGRVSAGQQLPENDSYNRFFKTTNAVQREGSDHSKKLLLLSWEYPPNLVGGLARHVGALAESLVKLGFEVHVITANPGNLTKTETVNDVLVHRVEPLNGKDPDFLRWIGGLNVAMESKARELSYTHTFSLVHAHDWLVGACAISLKDVLGIPLISTIHATESGRNGGIYTELQSFIHKKEEQLIQQSDQLIVCSLYMKNEVIELFKALESKLTIIPNGAEHTSQHPIKFSAKQMPYVKESGRLIFSIGRMVQEKGFETLISAAHELRVHYNDIYFIIAGRGPMLEEYRKKVKECGLENVVFFPGFISDQQRAELFTICEMAVFPSIYEPFGIVALEAMTAGKPVIASNTGGLKGIVQHGSTGLLMNPNDHNSLIEQVSFLLDNREDARMLGVNGKQKAKSLFSWTRTAELTKRIYEEILIESIVMKQK
ncbi:glycosyltransferase [Cytobacillus gottheilii]|uniref:glycosyltransferase n=1 Tax=Cytobacillus gottheilii TaxID=859144 RepID=UPI0009BBDC4E|nr:glycosyltransferase [Cytobacillus gottheilii]